MQPQGLPAWSPDGRSIAFLGLVEGAPLLFVQSLDSPTPLQLTKPPTLPSSRPFWSPDSREIYFTAAGGIRKVSAGGGEPTLVQPNVLTGAISPDGRTLALLRLTQSPPSFAVWIASPPEAASKPYEPAPFKARDFTNPPNIHFAPDGRKILAAANLDGLGEQIWLLPWPPAQSRRLFSDLPLSGNRQFSWLPDSRHVLFSARTDPSSPARLFMSDVDTGRSWPVLADTRDTVGPSVSPDGTKAVFGSELGHYDVVEVPLDGGPIQTLLGSLRSEMMPAFSPMGRTLVYVTDRRGGYEVWLESLAEHRAWPLLSPSDFRLPSSPVRLFVTPAFSPDAQRIAVVAKNDAGCRLWIAGVAGSAPVRITTEDAVERSPTWSPDGQWIAYERMAAGRTTLAKVKVGASQPPIDLVQGLSILPLPEWSPTDEWIACAVEGKPGITLVSPDGKNTRFLPGVAAPHAWSRDGKTIYQVRGTTNCSLWAIDIATGKERVIRELGDLRPASPLNPGLRVTLAPDGKSLAWAVNRARLELWILEGLRIPRPWFQRLLGRP